MTVISLVVGLVLGAVAVVFIMQNVSAVTVTFLGAQFTASLAVILMLTLLCGIITALLVLLPSFIRDVLFVSRLKRENRRLQEEADSYKKTLDARPPAPADDRTA